MKNLITKFKSKYGIIAFGVLVMVTAFGFTSVPASATSCSNTSPTPVFNYWPLSFNNSNSCNDLPLIDALNTSAPSGSRDARYSNNQAEHDAGINANVGDKVFVSIYFDNGSSDDNSVFTKNTMRNFTVSSAFDTGATTTHTISGTLRADNVPTVSSTSNHQGGNITINTPTSTTLQYVSGTTQACIGHDAALDYGVDMSKTCGTDAQGQAKILVPLPDGIANGTVSMGDLPPCFPYSGTVGYLVQVVGSQIITSNGSLAITKQVEDVTSNNNNNFASSVNANQGDTVEFKITVSNTSNITLNNVIVNDPAVSGLQFVGTSSQGATFNIGTMVAGQNITEYVNEQVVASNGTLTNTATATASNANSAQASATVYVNGYTPPVQTYGQLNITKNVRDITHSNSNGFVKSTNAFTGDQVQYQIVVTNTGSNSLSNVTVTDALPAGDSYISGTVDNGSYTNGTIQYLGTMYAGQSHTITITATVNGSNGQTIQNTATASATNTPTVSDSALVYLTGAVLGTNTNFSYSKSAFNETKNVDATSVPADKEDYITYTLTATNTGNTQATNFVISDDLTNVLNYASMVNLNGGTLNGSTITWPSVTIAPNTSVNETFRVRVNYNLPSSYNNLQLVNTYGNTVTIQINNPRVLGATITAPTTGPAGEAALALGFAAILTLGFHFGRKAYLARKSA